MRRTAYACEVVVWHIIHLMEILRAHQVLIWHYTLYRSNDKLITYILLQFPEMVFQIRRRRHKHKRVIITHYLVDIRCERDFIKIKMHTREISGVVSHAFEILYTVIPTHIPPYVVSIVHHNLCDGRCPTAATYYSYLSAVKHISTPLPPYLSNPVYQLQKASASQVCISLLYRRFSAAVPVLSLP